MFCVRTNARKTRYTASHVSRWTVLCGRSSADALYRTGGVRTGRVWVMQGLLNVPCVGFRFSFVTSGNNEVSTMLCSLWLILAWRWRQFVRNIGNFGTRLHGITFPRTLDLGVFQFDRQRLVSVKFLALADRIGTRVTPDFALYVSQCSDWMRGMPLPCGQHLLSYVLVSGNVT